MNGSDEICRILPTPKPGYHSGYFAWRRKKVNDICDVFSLINLSESSLFDQMNCHEASFVRNDEAIA